MRQVVLQKWVKDNIPHTQLDRFWDLLEKYNGSRIFGATYDEDVLNGILQQIKEGKSPTSNVFPGFVQVPYTDFIRFISQYKVDYTDKDDRTYINIRAGKMIAIRYNPTHSKKRKDIQYFVNKEDYKRGL